MAKATESGSNALPDSEHMAAGERVGVKDSGYLTKKGLDSAQSTKLNCMPPGMNIEDQKNADINAMPMKTVVSLGYPGDGWSG